MKLTKEDMKCIQVPSVLYKKLMGFKIGKYEPLYSVIARLAAYYKRAKEDN